MFNVTRRGASLGDAAAFLATVPQGIIPYATATALTRTAKAGQVVLTAAMARDFDRPTPYTLNSTFIVPATKDKLSAQIGIKNQAGANLAPEHYLLPEVFGGGRNEKRFEVALRLAGFLRAGERAMPGGGVQLDAYGNVAAGTVRTILRQASGAKSSRIFVGTAGRKHTRGVWQRDGKSVKPLFVFTTATPQYRPRFDFDAEADKSARATFQTEFYGAVQTLLAKGRA